MQSFQDMQHRLQTLGREILVHLVTQSEIQEIESSTISVKTLVSILIESARVVTEEQPLTVHKDGVFSQKKYLRLFKSCCQLLLHRQLSTILSVVSSSQKVDLVKFKSLCLEASYNICDNFSWTRINHTLHGPLHHGVELITGNDGYGLGSLSEECLEANNKDIRNYLQFPSRKVSPEAQVTDVMNRLLERSDPGILHLSMASQRKKYCTHVVQLITTIQGWQVFQRNGTQVLWKIYS